jgi:hypothetical protein
LIGEQRGTELLRQSDLSVFIATAIASDCLIFLALFVRYVVWRERSHFKGSQSDSKKATGAPLYHARWSPSGYLSILSAVFRDMSFSHRRSGSGASESSYPGSVHHAGKALEKPILVYHDSARSIVFRDHLRRAVRHQTTHQDQHGTTSSVDALRHSSDLKNTTEVSHDRHGTAVMNMLLPGGLPATSSPKASSGNETGALFVPTIVPLPNLELGPTDEYKPLLTSTLEDSDDFTEAELEVCRMLHTQQCVVKTIKNVDWGDFLQRFRHSVHHRDRSPNEHADIPPSTIRVDGDHVSDGEASATSFPFNSFVTSTSLLPPDGKRMRCFGSTNQYTTGVIFALPSQHKITSHESDTLELSETQDEAAQRTQTWSWPAGYSVRTSHTSILLGWKTTYTLTLVPNCETKRLQAKTEFNIDSRGRLIHGRQEALVSLSVLRQYNEDYVHKNEYMIGNRLVSGLVQIPYNEVFLRVGGLGRLVNDRDCATGVRRVRTFDRGCGIPVALFVRSAMYGHLISLMRTRARMMNAFGEAHVKNIPLLLIDPELGVRVLTESLERNLWKVASSNLTPFQNSTISYKTTLQHTDDKSFQQKVDELISFDDTIRETLTPEELARLAGGFGATDDSVATVLHQVMLEDKKLDRQSKHSDESEGGDGEKSHLLQDVVNEGLAAAVRSGDYHTSRQLLMLYSLVASHSSLMDEDDDEGSRPSSSAGDELGKDKPSVVTKQASMGSSLELSTMDLALMQKVREGTLVAGLPSPPPPPPLDTDRLRSATNSDGLLAVLGAAQVLKAMQDGSAKQRAQEVVSAVEEWINHGEQSMAFRIASYFDQRAGKFSIDVNIFASLGTSLSGTASNTAQGDLKIATENDSQFMAFVSNKAISNRKMFAQQIRDAIDNTNFNDLQFLLFINQILSKMNSPCLRLELLQYVLGLDNRYSVAHVARSVELAASCLSIAALPSVQAP